MPEIAQLVIASSGPGKPGDPYPLAPELIEPMGWTLGDGVARYTRVYRHQGGLWISGFAPVLDAQGRPEALLHVAYPVEIYLDRLHELRNTLLLASGVGALATLVLGLWALRRLTRPIALLTGGVSRVAAGDLSTPLRVASRDEVGRLTQAFNSMLEGLRQRDFIRSAFGRYVSPEVAQAILESPEGLQFGGTKRIVTVLMSDLRGYTRFAEQGAPEQVMEVLNGYLARMAEVVIAHGGTINEFIGDAIFAVYGAPVPHPDHAERAAATALAMQAALADINAEHARRALPAFEMGIGLHTGEAVVGNIGSEQRAKYAVVGSAVNVASRVESATVGGQVLLTARTLSELGALARVGPSTALQVKGLSEPLVVHELQGLGRPVRAGHAGAGGSAPGDRGLSAGVLGDRREDRAPRRPGRTPRAPGAARAPRAAGRAPGAPDECEAQAPVPGAALPAVRGHLRQGAPGRRRGPRADAPHGGRPCRRAGARTAARLGRATDFTPP